jgi:methylated-DNA-[protein]-cysteine S-methyltransferase
MTYYTHVESPLGRLILASDGTALTGLYLPVHKHGPEQSASWQRDDDLPVFAAARRQLHAYFEGGLKEFDLPLAPEGTAFQKRVWKQLEQIPFGKTISYGELARRIGNPNASRAVGLANGRNPISIVVPCHRVIGADGSLTGYGGGVERKDILLRHEAEVATRRPAAAAC